MCDTGRLRVQYGQTATTSLWAAAKLVASAVRRISASARAAANSSKRTTPPPFVSSRRKVARRCSAESPASSSTAPQLSTNSSSVRRRSPEVSMAANALNKFVYATRYRRNTRNSLRLMNPVPLRSAALYARMMAGLLLKSGHSSMTALSSSARDSMPLPLKSTRLKASAMDDANGTVTRFGGGLGPRWLATRSDATFLGFKMDSSTNHRQNSSNRMTPPPFRSSS
mmetsp:Transcript_12107/g.37677  ORF Transcript_12107/g.37677 Transcript_12107/m.37677 type:complete len:226 (-) Transcript_12107:840-1517(-)